MKIGQTIRRMRRQKLPDLTMADFACVVGVTPVTMSKIETGKQDPSIPFLEKVGKALSCPVSHIILTAESLIEINKKP